VYSKDELVEINGARNNAFDTAVSRHRIDDKSDVAQSLSKPAHRAISISDVLADEARFEVQLAVIRSKGRTRDNPLLPEARHYDTAKVLATDVTCSLIAIPGRRLGYCRQRTYLCTQDGAHGVH
jgi:hypothetical protein